MRTPTSRNVKVGVTLIVLGVLFLLYNLDIIRIRNWWPILLILAGLAFFLVWFGDRKQTGLLLPGSILVILGCQFLFLNASWPIYVLAPAVGFWLMYLLGERDVGLLVPAFILTIIALVFWFQGSILEDLWPVLFIVLGVILLLWPKPDKTTEVSPGPSESPAEPDEDTPA